MATLTSLDDSQLPPDWVGLEKNGDFAFTEDFNNSFSYNAIRIPLYHLRGGRETHLFSMAEAMSQNTQDLDVLNDPDPGYKTVLQLTSCVSGFDRTPIDAGRVHSSTYYGTVLELLSRSAARALHPECLRRTQ
jgi:endo-1,4-beta-D-glucanase Y